MLTELVLCFQASRFAAHLPESRLRATFSAWEAAAAEQRRRASAVHTSLRRLASRGLSLAFDRACFRDFLASFQSFD